MLRINHLQVLVPHGQPIGTLGDMPPPQFQHQQQQQQQFQRHPPQGRGQPMPGQQGIRVS